jgi:hypothetical protein
MPLQLIDNKRHRYIKQDLTMIDSIFIMCFELIDPVEVMVRHAGLAMALTKLKLRGLRLKGLYRGAER